MIFDAFIFRTSQFLYDNSTFFYFYLKSSKYFLTISSSSLVLLRFKFSLISLSTPLIRCYPQNMPFPLLNVYLFFFYPPFLSNMCVIVLQLLLYYYYIATLFSSSPSLTTQFTFVVATECLLAGDRFCFKIIDLSIK